MDKAKLLKKAYLLFPLSFIMLSLLLFVPAGTLSYWPGWLFLADIFIPLIITLSYLIKHDPALLQKRMQYREKELKQKLIVKLSSIFFLLVFLIPPLDFRFGWSNLSPLVIIPANLIIFLSYILVFLVFKENSYTSRIVEVVKGQKVISTGPYAEVRHPMYTGVILMMTFTPLALGSWWALSGVIPIIALMIFRTLEEEKLLIKDLKGYKEYTKKVKYRLLPKIW
jgi:protein-S-isoprenylcysteine O-methyltransferase Ste14